MASLDTLSTFGSELTADQLNDVDGGLVPLFFAIGFVIGFGGAWLADQ